MTQASAGAMPWSKPSENRFCAPRKQLGCWRRSWSGSSPGPQEDVARLQDGEVGDLSPTAVTGVWQARRISVFEKRKVLIESNGYQMDNADERDLFEAVGNLCE